MRIARKAAQLATTLALILACVVMLGILSNSKAIFIALFKDTLYDRIPESALSPPLYPNAHALRVTQSVARGKCVSFQTQDSPSNLVAFYNEKLKADNWVHPLVGHSYPENVFEWNQGGPVVPTDRAFRFFTDISSSGDITFVQLYLIEFNPKYDEVPSVDVSRVCAVSQP